MTTFIWTLMIYSLTVLISEAVIVWSMTTWMRKMQRTQDIMNHPIINWRYAVLVIALVPIINLYVTWMLIFSYYQYRRFARKSKDIADKLRDIGSRNPQARQQLDEIAKYFEELPDKD